jgi:hypothetical protein
MYVFALSEAKSNEGMKSACTYVKVGSTPPEVLKCKVS